MTENNKRAEQSAYPIPASDLAGSYEPQPGLTIREYAAIQLMQGLLANSAIAEATANHPLGVAEVRARIAEAAVSSADQLFAALFKESP
jgi:hypothetical protein